MPVPKGLLVPPSILSAEILGWCKAVNKAADVVAQRAREYDEVAAKEKGKEKFGHEARAHECRMIAITIRQMMPPRGEDLEI